MIRRLLLMSVTVAVTVAAILPGNAQATRKPTRTEVRGMTAAAVPPGGRIGWAQISTAGPYAVAWVVAARPRDPSFQDALLLLKGSGNRWGLTADIYHEGCPRVPRKGKRSGGRRAGVKGSFCLQGILRCAAGRAESGDRA